MKNVKTPRIDGFPAEFFKVFWGKIKHFMLRAFNCSFKHNCLSESLRTCVITCLPKGDKPREFLKNWRPLSMLSLAYKILSASLVNRMKAILTNLVSETRGFVPGRFIGDNTRLMYDVMYYLNKNNKVGLLMLIDFEKAFDSISWVFINKVLKFFNFGETFIKWVTILNSKIKGTVIQCGNLSKFFNIKRGCRQGDPISPYLFIIINTKNTIVKGTDIHGYEVKISQFADDTTIFLDGSQSSLQAALNILETFRTILDLY